jgi:hypothetical protein
MANPERDPAKEYDDDDDDDAFDDPAMDESAMAVAIVLVVSIRTIDHSLSTTNLLEERRMNVVW